MKRQSMRNAYRDIRPDEETKERMLQNILSASSEISPAGKDEQTVRKNFGRILLIAAIIALMACTVATASELLKVPVKETAEFVSNDGSIEFFLDLNEEVYGELIPSVKVEPHFFTGEEAKQVATVLFGDAEFYEYEPYDLIEYSKDEIQEKLDRWNPYTSKEALRELYANEGKDDAYIEEAKEIVNSFISRYSAKLKEAPEDNPHTPSQWKLRNSIEYIYPEEEWEEKYSPESNQEVSAFLKYNGMDYYFRASQRNNETFRVNNINAGIGGAISPDGIDDLIYRAQLCRTPEPTEEQIAAVKSKAENWLSQMGMGSWMVDECFVETHGSGAYTEYYIHVNAVPVFNGIPAMRREQLFALRGREEGVTYYYYTDVEFEFSPNGDLINFSMYSPVDIVDSSYETESLSIETLLDIAKEHLITSSASNYSFIPGLYEGFVDVGCRITVTGLDYSLTRTTDVDDRKPFVYSLGVSLSGSVEYYNKENGEVIAYEENRILLVLDGADGSYVSRG